MRKFLEIRIEKNSDGMQLQSFLRQELHFTRAQIKSLKFRTNGILVNDIRARVNRILHEGDLLYLNLEDEANCSPQLIPAGEMPEILYEDADLVCVDKPSGLVVHPSPGHYQDSLSNRMRGYFLSRGEDVQVRSIGRLDKDTSGIVVFAKHQMAAARLWRQREEGVFRKEYLAWCEGIFPPEAAAKEQRIQAPIAHMPGELMKMYVPAEKSESGDNVPGRRSESGDDVPGRRSESGDDVPGKKTESGSPESGQDAVTRYQVLRQLSDRALVRFYLETGRTHQIRVHMSWLGHPLIGDPIYGNGKMGRDHAMLCACRAKFRQPFTGEMIEVTASDSRSFLKNLNLGLDKTCDKSYK